MGMRLLKIHPLTTNYKLHYYVIEQKDIFILAETIQCHVRS